MHCAISAIQFYVAILITFFPGSINSILAPAFYAHQLPQDKVSGNLLLDHIIGPPKFGNRKPKQHVMPLVSQWFRIRILPSTSFSPNVFPSNQHHDMHRVSTKAPLCTSSRASTNRREVESMSLGVVTFYLFVTIKKDFFLLISIRSMFTMSLE